MTASEQVNRLRKEFGALVYVRVTQALDKLEESEIGVRYLDPQFPPLYEFQGRIEELTALLLSYWKTRTAYGPVGPAMLDSVKRLLSKIVTFVEDPRDSLVSELNKLYKEFGETTYYGVANGLSRLSSEDPKIETPNAMSLPAYVYRGTLDDLMPKLDAYWSNTKRYASISHRDALRLLLKLIEFRDNEEPNLPPPPEVIPLKHDGSRTDLYRMVFNEQQTKDYWRDSCKELASLLREARHVVALNPAAASLSRRIEDALSQLG